MKRLLALTYGLNGLGNGLSSIRSTTASLPFYSQHCEASAAEYDDMTGQQKVNLAVEENEKLFEQK